MAARNPANDALLTIALMGAKAVASCARCVILDQLTNDEVEEFRSELEAVEQSASAAREMINRHLEAERPKVA